MSLEGSLVCYVLPPYNSILCKLAGVPLHPSYRTLMTAVDSFASHALGEFVAFVLAPPYVIPSSRFMASSLPSSLVTHVLSRLPPPPYHTFNREDKLTSSTSPLIYPQQSEKDLLKQSSTVEDSRAALVTTSGSPFIGMTIPSVNFHMDVRNFKWHWPGYLGLGKALSLPSPSSPKASPIPGPPPTISQPEHEASQTQEQEETTGKDPPTTAPDEWKHRHPDDVEVDSESLLEAMTTEGLRPPSITESSPTSEELSVPHTSTVQQRKDEEPSNLQEPKARSQCGNEIELPDQGDPLPSIYVPIGPSYSLLAADDSRFSLPEIDESLSPNATEEKPELPPQPPFRDTVVFVSDPPGSLHTQRLHVSHLTVSRPLGFRPRI